MTLKGKIVQHPSYGKGFVVKERGGVFELLVRFQNGLQLWIRRSELIVPDQRYEQTFALPSSPLIDNLDGLCVIETLRLGLVPLDKVSTFTFGRNAEMEFIIKWLKEKSQGSVFLVGDYGTGKSHMLDYVKDYALKNNWAVAHCELNPNETPLYKPKKIYSRVIESFQCLLEGKLNDFKSLAIKASKQRLVVDNPYVKLLLQLVEYSEEAWRWFQGNAKTSFYGLPLYDNATSANIYCSILSSIGELCIRIGLKGFLILFDEAENINLSWLYRSQFLKGENFFLGLCLTSLGSDLLNEELSLDYSSGFWRGKKSGLLYSAKQHIAYFSSIAPSMKVIFAFANVPFSAGFLAKSHASQLHIRALDYQTKIEILNAVYSYYTSAYPKFAYDGVTEMILDIIRSYGGNTRLMIKSFIEALDILRYYNYDSHREIFS